MADYLASAFAAACAESRRLQAENERLRDQVERVIAGVRTWCSINEIAEPPLDWAGLGEFLDRAAIAEPEGGR